MAPLFCWTISRGAVLVGMWFHLRSSDGGILFVNRGFSPNKAWDFKSAGKVRNLWVLFETNGRAFLPDNDPVAKIGFELLPKVPEHDLKGVFPFWVTLEVPAGSTDRERTPELPPNNHRVRLPGMPHLSQQ